MVIPKILLRYCSIIMSPLTGLLIDIAMIAINIPPLCGFQLLLLERTVISFLPSPFGTGVASPTLLLP